MSDTVKLIIEIPKETYLGIRGGYVIKNTTKITKVIKNGIPLDDVKAEIMAKHFSIVEKTDFDNGRTYGYDECLSILDNIGKGESE